MPAHSVLTIESRAADKSREVERTPPPPPPNTFSDEDWREGRFSVSESEIYKAYFDKKFIAKRDNSNKKPKKWIAHVEIIAEG